MLDVPECQPVGGLRFADLTANFTLGRDSWTAFPGGGGFEPIEFGIERSEIGLHLLQFVAELEKVRPSSFSSSREARRNLFMLSFM